MKLPKQTIEFLPVLRLGKCHPGNVVVRTEMWILHPIGLIHLQEHFFEAAAQYREMAFNKIGKVLLQRFKKGVCSPFAPRCIHHHRRHVHGNVGNFPFDHQIVECTKLSHC